LAKPQKNALAQFKLKDFQEGQTVIEKACGLRTGKPRNETSQIKSKRLAFCFDFQPTGNYLCQSK